MILGVYGSAVTFFADTEVKLYPDTPSIHTVVAESIEDEMTPFELTVEVELDTTKGIYEILDAAIEAHDYKTVAWLNAEGKLIQEQIEEEHVSKVILEIAKQEDSWISKASAIRAAYEKIS